MRNRDILALQLKGLQNITAHDISPAHAYKVYKLKDQVAKAYKAMMDQSRKNLEEEGIEDFRKEKEKCEEMKARLGGLSESERAEYDDLSSRLERFEEVDKALLDEEVTLDVKVVPFDVWHELQKENRSKTIYAGNRPVGGVDILSGEAEGILENVFWVPPAEEENI